MRIRAGACTSFLFFYIKILKVTGQKESLNALPGKEAQCPLIVRVPGQQIDEKVLDTTPSIMSVSSQKMPARTPRRRCVHVQLAINLFLAAASIDRQSDLIGITAYSTL